MNATWQRSSPGGRTSVRLRRASARRSPGRRRSARTAASRFDVKLSMSGSSSSMNAMTSTTPMIAPTIAGIAGQPVPEPARPKLLGVDRRRRLPLRLVLPVRVGRRAVRRWHRGALHGADPPQADRDAVAFPAMDFSPSDRVTSLTERLDAFLDEHVYPVELEALQRARRGGRARRSLPAHPGRAARAGEGRGALEPVPAGRGARRRA